MTCCRAQHPEELVEQLGYLRDVAAETGDDASRLVISLPGDAQHRRLGGRGARPPSATTSPSTTRSCPKAMDLSNWGPVGTPEQIIEWFRTFADGGRRPLHLPLRLARPVRAGGAVRARRAAGAPRAEPASAGG